MIKIFLDNDCKHAILSYRATIDHFSYVHLSSESLFFFDFIELFIVSAYLCLRFKYVDKMPWSKLCQNH